MSPFLILLEQGWRRRCWWQLELQNMQSSSQIVTTSKPTSSIGWYQIILLGDRGTCVLTTCPGLHSTAERLGFEPTTYWSQVFVYRLDTLPVAQQTLSENWRKKVSYSMDSLTPGSLGGFPSSSLITKGSWIHWRQGCQVSCQLSDGSIPQNTTLARINLKLTEERSIPLQHVYCPRPPQAAAAKNNKPPLLSNA